MERRRKQPNLFTNKDYQPEGGVEPCVMAGEQSQSEAGTEGRDGSNEQGRLLEQILSRDNMNLAYLRVKGNAGSAGIDGMTTGELLEHLKTHRQSLLHDLLTGMYRPQAVKRVEIQKQEGGKRGLGIPTAVDRLIQQAVSQVLIPIFDAGFS